MKIDISSYPAMMRQSIHSFFSDFHCFPPLCKDTIYPAFIGTKVILTDWAKSPSDKD